MTLGYSKTVLAFLKNAHRKRKFTVLVAESAPRSVVSMSTAYGMITAHTH